MEVAHGADSAQGLPTKEPDLTGFYTHKRISNMHLIHFYNLSENKTIIFLQVIPYIMTCRQMTGINGAGKGKQTVIFWCSCWCEWRTTFQGKILSATQSALHL